MLNNQAQQEGAITLSFSVPNVAEPLKMHLANSDQSCFMRIAKIAIESTSGIYQYPFSDGSLTSVIDDNSNYVNLHEKSDEEVAKEVLPEEKIESGNAYMSDFNRNELQAHLKASKAEVDAVAASMKKDMAEWRELMRSDLRDVKEAISAQNSSLDKHFHAQEVKLNSSIELQTSRFELALTNAKLDIIKWALGLPALAFVVYKIYGLIIHTPTP